MGVNTDISLILLLYSICYTRIGGVRQVEIQRGATVEGVGS